MHPGNRAPVSRLPTNVVNAALTIFGRCGHGAAMEPSKTHAGGCFLSLCILIGFPVGLAIGNPLKGVLIGTAVGILIAVALWLVDRSRRGE